MKYLLWKFPYAVSYEDENNETCDPHPIEAIIGKPKLELIDSLTGKSLDEIGGELLESVRMDLRAIYDCPINLYGIDEVYALDTLIPDKHFDYEILAYVVEPKKEVNTAFYYGIQEVEE